MRDTPHTETQDEDANPSWAIFQFKLLAIEHNIMYDIQSTLLNSHSLKSEVLYRCIIARIPSTYMDVRQALTVPGALDALEVRALLNSWSAFSVPT